MAALGKKFTMAFFFLRKISNFEVQGNIKKTRRLFASTVFPGRGFKLNDKT